MSAAKFGSAISCRTAAGIADCSFVPPLDPAQYRELWKHLEPSLTEEQFLELARSLAERWQVALAVQHFELQPPSQQPLARSLPRRRGQVRIGNLAVAASWHEGEGLAVQFDLAQLTPEQQGELARLRDSTQPVAVELHPAEALYRVVGSAADTLYLAEAT